MYEQSGHPSTIRELCSGQFCGGSASAVICPRFDTPSRRTEEEEGAVLCGNLSNRCLLVFWLVWLTVIAGLLCSSWCMRWMMAGMTWQKIGRENEKWRGKMQIDSLSKAVCTCVCPLVSAGVCLSVRTKELFFPRFLSLSLSDNSFFSLSIF